MHTREAAALQAVRLQQPLDHGVVDGGILDGSGGIGAVRQQQNLACRHALPEHEIVDDAGGRGGDQVGARVAEAGVARQPRQDAPVGDDAEIAHRLDPLVGDVEDQQRPREPPPVGERGQEQGDRRRFDEDDVGLGDPAQRQQGSSP